MGFAGKMFGISAVVVVLGIFGLQSLGNHVEAEFAAQSYQPALATAAESADEVVTEMSPTTTTAHRAGSTMLEQAIFDAFPPATPKTKSERRTTQNAADFVAATINSAGHLCAGLIEVQEAAPGQYGIGCVKHRDGAGRTNYLIDSRTGRVDEI